MVWFWWIIIVVRLEFSTNPAGKTGQSASRSTSPMIWQGNALKHIYTHTRSFPYLSSYRLTSDSDVRLNYLLVWRGDRLSLSANPCHGDDSETTVTARLTLTVNTFQFKSSLNPQMVSASYHHIRGSDLSLVKLSWSFTWYYRKFTYVPYLFISRYSKIYVSIHHVFPLPFAKNIS